jgi:hypothetical protein
LAGLTFFFVTRLGALETILSCPSLMLKDGRQFTAVQIINYTATGVLVRHAGGATTIRIDLLPSSVATALHLQPWEIANAANAGLNSSLADRPAIAADGSTPATAMAAVADRPAVAEQWDPTLADRPAIGSETPTLAVAPAIAETDISAPEAQPSNPAAPRQVAGRIVVRALDGNPILLGDVEVRAYPPQLLATYLAEAKAKCSAAAEALRAQAMAAAANGNYASSAALASRAASLASGYLEYLPPPPFSTHSDEFGFFTLEHTLAEVRIVAVGHMSSAQGDWSFEWVGVTAGNEINLTEANATAVIAPHSPSAARFAAR